MVDGAHAFAQLDYKIPDLRCDYYGASPTNGLAAPLGAGLLYVKKERIAGCGRCSLIPAWRMTTSESSITKGRTPVHTGITIPEFTAFHAMIKVRA